MSIKNELERLSQQAESMSLELKTLREMVDEDPDRSPSDNDLVFIPDLARILEVSEATIYRYIRKGILEPYKLGKKPYWLRSELPEILKSMTAKK